jgi:hypothetical protein
LDILGERGKARDGHGERDHQNVNRRELQGFRTHSIRLRYDALQDRQQLIGANF